MSSKLANDHASGSARSTIAGWKLKNVAVTTSGPTGPIAADRLAK
jgi:hypothetical protein